MLLLLTEGLLSASLDSDRNGWRPDFVPSLLACGDRLFFRKSRGDRVCDRFLAGGETDCDFLLPLLLSLLGDLDLDLVLDRLTPLLLLLLR